VSESAKSAVAARLSALGLARDEPYLLVNAGARPGSAKAVPTALWARALELVPSVPALVPVLASGPGEERAVHDLLRELRGRRVLALVEPPPTLAELAALAARAALVWTGDTGGRHVAQAAGARVVAVLGPSDPRHTGDHLERTRLVHREVPCGPCHLERCPLSGADHQRCLAAIEPEALVRVSMELL
jgi:ADP-heptose:LPS heptosyltransferase